MKYAFMFCIVAALYLLVAHRLDTRYAEGLAEGRRTALHATPPSEELETVCAGLWIGEQAKKQYQKEMK